MCATSIAVGVGTPELARRGDKSVAERYLSSGLPFFSAVIGMNEHWTTLTRRRLLVEHGWHPAREFRDIRLLAVTTATGWTRPRAGFAQMFQHLSKWSIHRAHQALLFSAERGATVACQKSGYFLFIPDLIPQPDWDKYHLFRDKSHTVFDS